jgi:hypothetical protein
MDGGTFSLFHSSPCDETIENRDLILFEQVLLRGTLDE